MFVFFGNPTDETQCRRLRPIKQPRIVQHKADVFVAPRAIPRNEIIEKQFGKEKEAVYTDLTNLMLGYIYNEDSQFLESVNCFENAI
jgi:hypothetical protein